MRLLLLLICLSISVVSISQEKKNGKVTMQFDQGIEKGRMRHGLRQGVWRRYDSGGRLIYQVDYTNGIKDGDEINYNYQDSITSRGHYQNGRKHGVFISAINGRTISLFNYQMDTLHGVCLTNSPDKSFAGSYDHGKKTGVWVVDSIDYRRKHIKDSTVFSQGARNGKSYIYVNSVLVSKTQWVSGKRNGECEEFDENTGELIARGSYINNNKDGIWYAYKNSKLFSVEDFENGIHVANTKVYGRDTSIVTGILKYNPDGSKKMAQYNDESGKLVQRWYYGPEEDVDSIISYYPNGRVKEGHYTAYENVEGYTQFFLFMSYYPNGNLETRGYEYKKSRNGAWLTYDSTGKLFAQVHYDNNIPFGWFQTYHPNGKVKMKAYCYEGMTDTILVYSKTGTKVLASDPAYSKTIEEVQSSFTEITFRDPNKFPADHHRKGKVSLGDPVSDGIWSEVPASFPGGNDALNNFITRTIVYPEPERRLGIEGTVVIRFLIEKDGSLSDIQVAQKVEDAPGFTKETLRMMRVMPNWTPAQSKSKVVRVYHQLPVKFSLQ